MPSRGPWIDHFGDNFLWSNATLILKGMAPYGAKDEDEGIEIAKKFSLKDVAGNITCPFLVTHAGNDRVVPVENAQKLYDAFGSTNKTIKIFTTEEGGAEHAHVDNRQVGIDFAADWLEENMK